MMLPALLLPALLSTPSWADIALPPPTNARFLTYEFRVENLAAHSDYVLLAYDPGSTIHAHRVFTEASPQQLMANGASSRGSGYSRPRLHLMKQAAYESWSALTSAEVMRQQAACADRGEGCAHISRFVPTYAPPEGAVDCGYSMNMRTQGPEDGPSKAMDTVKLVEASDTACLVEPVAQGASATPAAPQGALERETEAVEEGRGCATAAGSVGSLLLGLSLVLGLSRRRED